MMMMMMTWQRKMVTRRAVRAGYEVGGNKKDTWVVFFLVFNIVFLLFIYLFLVGGWRQQKKTWVGIFLERYFGLIVIMMISRSNFFGVMMRLLIVIMDTHEVKVNMVVGR